MEKETVFKRSAKDDESNTGTSFHVALTKLGQDPAWYQLRLRTRSNVSECSLESQVVLMNVTKTYIEKIADLLLCASQEIPDEPPDELDE